MAEAEDVITDAARHATIFARNMWLRHRHDPNQPALIELTDVAERLDLLVGVVFGARYPLKTAQAPARPTFLAKMLRRHDLPLSASALPSTDGNAIWLPPHFHSTDFTLSLTRFRTVALQQAMRVQRGSAKLVGTLRTPLEADLFLMLEACAADLALERMLPGLAESLASLRRFSLANRPRLESLSAWHKAAEMLLQSMLHEPGGGSELPDIGACETPDASRAVAQQWAARLTDVEPASPKWGAHAFIKDTWTGEFLSPSAAASLYHSIDEPDPAETSTLPRSAKLTRRPKVREAIEDEDDEHQGVWMVQSAQPIEHAEDPMGMQRPTDRDDQTPAEEFADSLSELAEARLVSTPGSPKDVLMSDDAPDGHATTQPQARNHGASQVIYPEWDYRANAYRSPGATVHLLEPVLGPLDWVDKTLDKHRAILQLIRRRFEMLRPERTRLRKQAEGDSVDLDAYIEALCDRRAGRCMPEGLYESQRPGKRDMAIMLLIDISGSTDSWVSSNQRIIDVEREALLLVCTALESLGQPYSVQAFSGEGPHGVTVSAIKKFDEHYDQIIAQRIAALEPERYTRAGAAIRHAGTLLMREPAPNRLLLLLSDGKPCDADDYEGRYGVEDMRQAVNEAKLQGVFPFCLTIDRQAADYLPYVFGAGQYALLPKPELLPTVLLDWMRRLLSA
jgi:nitric oxide reductase NorD protein